MGAYSLCILKMTVHRIPNVFISSPQEEQIEMKQAIKKLFACLMLAVMFFDAAPFAALAEDLQTGGELITTD